MIRAIDVVAVDGDGDVGDGDGDVGDGHGAQLQTQTTAAVVDDEPEPGK